MSLPVSECNLHNLLCYPIWKPEAVQWFRVCILSKSSDEKFLCTKHETEADFGNIINILVELATRGRPREQDFGQCPKEAVQGTLLGLLFIVAYVVPCITKTIFQLETIGELTSQIMLQEADKAEVQFASNGFS